MLMDGQLRDEWTPEWTTGLQLDHPEIATSGELKSKATSSRFLVKMIAKLEST